MPRYLSIDIETYCDLDIRKVGMHKYIAHPSFEILMLSYAFDDADVIEMDLTNKKIPRWFAGDLINPEITKTAWNAGFEITALWKELKPYLEEDAEAFYGKTVGDWSSQWYDTMMLSAMLGLPLSLGESAKALGLTNLKIDEGKALIRYFSMPCKPTKANGMRTRNLPEHNPEKWQQYITYNIADVEAEREARKKMEWFKIPESEKRLWEIDYKMNAEGVLIDKPFVENCVRMFIDNQEQLIEKAIKITGLSNPNSNAQLLAWFSEQGYEFDNLQKNSIPDYLELAEGEAKQMLRLRQEIAKTSIHKYVTMLTCRGEDNRIRGLLQFYGANRTGRYCLTGDHEVLTPKGWVSLEMWQGGEIACWAPQTETISFQKSKALEFDYTGKMLHLDCQRCDQVSTPDHKMPYWTDSGWQAEKLDVLKNKRFKFPFTGRRIISNSLEHLELRIIIMVQADGHYTSESGDLRLSFSKKRKIERCISLLRKAGIIFLVANRNRQVTCVTIKNRDLPLYLRMFSEKTFGWWLLDENADIIFDELIHWDSSTASINSMQYVTTNKQNADIIQALAVTSGRSATILTRPRQENWKTAYKVNIWLNPTKHTETRKEFITEHDHAGKVYCAQTSTGFFLVRRNGKVWVTGNSGRLVQMQNLPKNFLKDLELAREIVQAGDLETLQLCFGNVPDVLSQLIRTAFVAPKNHVFCVADFSAIEARIIAWLAGEKWVMDVFANGEDLYIAVASKMFKIPIELIDKKSPYRQKGKVASLACGFQGGPDAMARMDYGKEIPADEYPELVEIWRKENPNIKKLWYKVQELAIAAVKDPGSVFVGPKGLKFCVQRDWLFIRLPSGRKLSYYQPRLKKSKWGGDSLTYKGISQERKIWCSIDTYGGKLVENIVQAIARDCLAEAILKLDKITLKIVMHVHDEIIIEASDHSPDYLLNIICEVMGQPIPWAPGLILSAEGYVTKFYKKD